MKAATPASSGAIISFPAAVFYNIRSFFIPRHHADRPPYLALLFCLVLLIAGLGGESIAPFAKDAANFTAILQPPAWLADGNITHILGTDQLGRDLLSRLIVGARVSLITAGAAIFVAGAIGIVCGLLAGYSGGFIDALIMRVVDAFLALPFILLAIALVAAFGSGIENIIIVMIITNWARYARLVRSEVISIKTRDYVTLARIAGASPARIAFHHILPNALNSIVVLAILDFGRAVILESSLSFLGLGIQPPDVSWGLMLADGKGVMTIAWWTAAFPGLAILLCVMSFNTVGDWLKAKFDPRGAL
jgi:peptide/nickel transport system permease protein